MVEVQSFPAPAAAAEPATGGAHPVHFQFENFPPQRYLLLSHPSEKSPSVCRKKFFHPIEEFFSSLMKYSSNPTLFIKVIQPRNLRNCFVLPASLPFRNNAISRFPLKDLNRIRLSCRKFSKGLPYHKSKSALTSNGNPKHKGQPQPTSQPLITSVRSAFLCENPQIYGFIDFSTPPSFCH